MSAKCINVNIPLFYLSIVDQLISALCTQIEHSLLAIITRHILFLLTSVFWDSVLTLVKSMFQKSLSATLNNDLKSIMNNTR